MGQQPDAERYKKALVIFAEAAKLAIAEGNEEMKGYIRAQVMAILDFLCPDPVKGRAVKKLAIDMFQHSTGLKLE